MLAKTQKIQNGFRFFFFLMAEKRLYLVKENVFGLIQIGLLLCTSVVMFATNMIYKIIARCLQNSSQLYMVISRPETNRQMFMSKVKNFVIKGISLEGSENRVVS